MYYLERIFFMDFHQIKVMSIQKKRFHLKNNIIVDYKLFLPSNKSEQYVRRSEEVGKTVISKVARFIFPTKIIITDKSTITGSIVSNKNGH